MPILHWSKHANNESSSGTERSGSCFDCALFPVIVKKKNQKKNIHVILLITHIFLPVRFKMPQKQ